MSDKKKKDGRKVDDRLKDIQHEVLVAVASGMPLPDVMSLLCKHVEEVTPGAICSIIRVDSAGRLRPLAAPSLPEAYSQSLDGVTIGPMVGACGSAAFLGKPVAAINIKTDPRWVAFKDRVLALGLKACWSSPIKSHDDRVIGTFAFYFATPRRANRIEQRVVARCVHVCTLAIEHWAAHERVRRLAFTDPLTGLGNRALLAEKLPGILDRASECGKGVAIFHANLDGFRTVNALRGNRAGDQLLCSVANRLRDAFRNIGLVTRLGGDEFLIVQTERESYAEFEATARLLGETLRESYRLDGDTEVKVSASIGIACFPGDGVTLDTLMGHADTALRHVKSAGGDRNTFYTARLDAENRAHRAFERDVSNAVEAGQLSLVYQPQADTASCSVRGFEALLRWNHPIHGFVSPAKFVPAAEACGAIGEIGAFVLREALTQAATWPKHLRVSVNVSPAQIVHADFAKLVEQTLHKTRVVPSRLEIEVTESLFIYDPTAALKTLNSLKALGVSVAMDDFGTGYSSLTTLRSFPFDRIKIDRSFVFDMVANADAAAIVNSIMGLGRAMGRPIVAEGVETQEQLDLLKQLGCDEVQGFLIGKPQAIEAYAHITGLSGEVGCCRSTARPARRAKKAPSRSHLPQTSMMME